jgi:hypothetical protein
MLMFFFSLYSSSASQSQTTMETDAVKLVVTGSGIAAAAAATSGVGILRGESKEGPSSVDRSTEKDRSDSIKSSGQHRQSSLTSRDSDETSNLLLKPPTSLQLKSSHLQDQSKGLISEISATVSSSVVTTATGLQTTYASKAHQTQNTGYKVVEVKVFHEKPYVSGKDDHTHGQQQEQCSSSSEKSREGKPSSLKRISNGSNRVSSSVSCASMHERDITASGAPSLSSTSYQHHPHHHRRQSPSSSTPFETQHHVSHQRRVTISENLITDFDHTQEEEEDSPLNTLENKKLAKSSSMKSSSSQSSSLSLRQRKGESVSREGSSKSSSSASAAGATIGSVSSQRSSFDSQRRSFPAVSATGSAVGGDDTDSLPDVDEEDLDMDSRL